MARCKIQQCAIELCICLPSVADERFLTSCGWDIALNATVDFAYFAKWFGNTVWFKELWAPVLNKMVNKLNAEVVESTPYNDIIW